MNIVWALIVFSIVVVIHELGHFLLARKNGVSVTEFSVGMGPRLVSFTRGGTRYSLKLFPIGGSCMMVGEDELSDDPNAFNKKSVWARISVIFAGPLFNFILAFLLSLFVIGYVGYDPALAVGVDEGSPAAEAGLAVGDLITEFGGKKITIGREMTNYLQFHPLDGSPVEVAYERDGKKYETVITPVNRDSYRLGFTYMSGDVAAEISAVTENEPLAQAGAKPGDVILAVNGQAVANGTELNQYMNQNPLADEPVTLLLSRGGEELTLTATPVYSGSSYYSGLAYNQGRMRTGVLGTLKYSLNEVKFWITSTVEGLGQMITGKVSKDDIAGPVGIVDMIGNTYEQSKKDGLFYILLNMANISILLSANLGVINLLPIPALDGGRLVFLIIEAIRGKPIAPEKEGIVHLIGFVALMLLMVLVLFNDISRILH